MKSSVDFVGDSNYDAYEMLAEADGKDLNVSSKAFKAMGKFHRSMQFMESINDKLLDLESDYMSAARELEAKIAECDDPVMRQQLAGSLDELEHTWMEITHHPPGMHREIGEFSEIWTDKVRDMRNSIMDASVAAQSLDELQLVGGGELQISEPVHLEKKEDVDNRRAQMLGDAVNRSNSTSSSSKSESDENMDLADLDIENMVNLMTSDPQAAMAELKNLSAEDRSIAMQMITQNLQNMNQMMSMMSNVTKTLHDTSKAIINNMRV